MILSPDIFEQAQLDLQELEKTQPVVHFEVTWRTALAALAFLQQIVRSPKYKNHPLQINAEGFALQLANRLNKTPALQQVIEAGWPEKGIMN